MRRVLVVFTLVVLLGAMAFAALAQNPCNPCAKKAQNPCNPCGKKAQNPCNPCGSKTASSEVYPPAASHSTWTKINKRPLLSQAHGGVFITTLVNASAEAAIKADAKTFPEGSIIVKESYVDSKGKPGAAGTIFAMEKTQDGWIWITTDSTGHITGKGDNKQMQMCSQCHSVAKRDYAYLRSQ